MFTGTALHIHTLQQVVVHSHQTQLTYINFENSITRLCKAAKNLIHKSIIITIIIIMYQ